MGALFLAFEGVEGSGKSTQATRLAETLTKQGLSVVLTYEPGSTKAGQLIRSLVLDLSIDQLSPNAEALLFAADRAEHVEKVIKPALDAGSVVISDRFIDSSLAYQGIARGLGLDEVFELNAFATGGLLPDMVFLLDMPAEGGLARSGITDRMESQGIGFHETVGEAYRLLASKLPSRFTIIDASFTADEIHTLVLDKVEELLHK